MFERLPGECSKVNRQLRLDQTNTVTNIEAEHGELSSDIPGADNDVDSTIADDVDKGRALCSPNRIVQREDQRTNRQARAVG